MSTTMQEARTTTTANAHPPVVTQSRVIASEWIKLRSLRSTFWSFFAAAGIVIGLGLLFSLVREQNWNQMSQVDKALFDPTQTSLRGTYLAQLAIGVLGVLAVTGEYSTGMIRATLSAVPRRLPVLWGKLVVFAAAVFVVMGVSSLIAFEAGQAIMGSTHHQASLSTPGALRAVIGGALFLTVICVLGIGLGFLLRSTAGAIATLFGLILVLPILVEALPSPWPQDITKFLPLGAGTVLMNTVKDPTMLSPWAGFGVFCLYAVAAIAAGAAMLKRRDA
ncbi:MAG: type transport system permease protein [Actinomycetota bacterium]|nr:type transport system permease protein [Actinomycetota bacterium]MDQ1540128.1 type transport system permease protein [Actinomycetota bacterium]